MKGILKVLAVAVAGALILTTAPAQARDGHHDGSNVGTIIAGIAAVGIIAAIASQHGDAHVHVEHYGPPPPPPPPQCWVPGHYETRREQVCVPGYWSTVVTPAEYGWVQQGHHSGYVLIKPECVRRVWVPERYEWRETQIWVPGHYETAGGYARAY